MCYSVYYGAMERFPSGMEKAVRAAKRYLMVRSVCLASRRWTHAVYQLLCATFSLVLPTCTALPTACHMHTAPSLLPCGAVLPSPPGPAPSHRLISSSIFCC